MAKLTLKIINKALTELCLKRGFEPTQLVKGNGYFYFNSPKLRETSVYVNKLEALTLEQWLKEFEDKIDESHNHI